MTHFTKPKISGDEVIDPVEQMVKKTGCSEFYSLVQECIAETQDWRKCQDQVRQFKTCMEEYQKNLENKYK